MYRKLSHMKYVRKTQTYSIIHLKHHATNDFQHQNWVQQASVARSELHLSKYLAVCLLLHAKTYQAFSYNTGAKLLG